MKEKELLKSALSEIKSLRDQNQLQRARLDMFDDIMSILYGNAAIKGEGLMHPDIVYDIEKYLNSDK